MFRFDSSISYGSHKDLETMEDDEEKAENLEQQLGQTSPLPSETVFFLQPNARPSLTNHRPRLFKSQESSPMFSREARGSFGQKTNQQPHTKTANGSAHEMIEMNDLGKKRRKNIGETETDSTRTEPDEKFNNRIDAANSLMLPLQA